MVKQSSSDFSVHLGCSDFYGVYSTVRIVFTATRAALRIVLDFALNLAAHSLLHYTIAIPPFIMNL